MDEPKAIDSLFKETIFRVPDYQRGYAWQSEQLEAFWEDLINLSADRSHYTGVLTLKKIDKSEISEREKEYWLVDEHGYQIYHIIDGQQRLTTFVIFIHAFLDCIRSLKVNHGKHDDEVFITENLSIRDVQDRYIFKRKPSGDQFRTYKFGYATDNPSRDYLRYNIFREPGSGDTLNTFYTLNLQKAYEYFLEQCKEWHKNHGMKGLQGVYKKVTRNFLLNEYVIKDEFDVYVAFETINNRGKRLSNLELLKNRLIYLTTLFPDSVLDKAARASIRETINDGWKEVYRQLGRSAKHPLNDDDFLRAHWIMYFKYSRETGRDYIRFLLDEEFTPRRVGRSSTSRVMLQEVQELRDEDDVEDLEEEVEEATTTPEEELKPLAIRDFVHSLKESAVHWFNTFHPDLASEMTEEEKEWIRRLNRVGITYFRPLVMAILKNEREASQRIYIYKKIERFIFIAFRLNNTKSNYRSSEFYNAARELDRGEITIDDVAQQLDQRLEYSFNDDGSYRYDDFYNFLYRKFQDGPGYYGWSALRYFLFEYEWSLLEQSRQQKVYWSNLKKSEADKISIEHIYPQTESEEWARFFDGVQADERPRYGASIGNLLLLSMSINASLQNDRFADKKVPKYAEDGRKLRNGYADGSHSEIEVSSSTSWGPKEIRERGIRLLKFMEQRWDFRFRNDADRERLLFLDR